MVVGSGVKELAATAGKFGATAVFVADDPAFEAPLPQPRVDALAQLVGEHGFDTVPSQPRCCRRTSPRGWRRAWTPA